MTEPFDLIRKQTGRWIYMRNFHPHQQGTGSEGNLFCTWVGMWSIKCVCVSSKALMSSVTNFLLTTRTSRSNVRLSVKILWPCWFHLTHLGAPCLVLHVCAFACLWALHCVPAEIIDTHVLHDLRSMTILLLYNICRRRMGQVQGSWLPSGR